MTERVTDRKRNVLSAYRYLADGTKIGVADEAGNGYEYLGSLIYRRTLRGLELESTDFSGGRIDRTTTGYRVNYFVRDYLGSVRAIADERGQRIEAMDYMPFGSRWNDPTRLVTDNRYQYNGKEWQPTGEQNVLDYGARHYDPTLGRWFNPDPAMQFLNPYTFCGNDPINLVDANGMYAKYEKDLEEFPKDTDKEDTDDQINHDKNPEAKKEIDKDPYAKFLYIPNFIGGYDKILSKFQIPHTRKLDWQNATPGQKIKAILDAYLNAKKRGQLYFNIREVVDNFPIYTAGEKRYAWLRINGIDIPIYMEIAYYDNMCLSADFNIKHDRPIKNYYIDGLFKKGVFACFEFHVYKPHYIPHPIRILEIQVPIEHKKFFIELLNY